MPSNYTAEPLLHHHYLSLYIYIYILYIHSGKLRYSAALESGPGLKMYLLSKMVIFQPAMLVYRRVYDLESRWLATPKFGGDL